MADITREPSTSKCDQAGEGAPPPYELTAADGARAHVPPLTAPRATHHYARPKNTAHFSNSYEMSGTESPMAATSTTQHTPSNITRKRKPSSYASGSTYEDDDRPRSTSSLPDKKQNHSEIEKRRRDKMNTYIAELSAIVPMCGAVPRKLDKLTVLRMAVQHLRSVRGALTACPLSSRPRPAFLSEKKLNALVLHAAQDCFLLVVSCDRGRLLYISTSVKKMLHYDQSELLGQSLFDILHPKDVAKVKEQLSSSNLSPWERLIDAKTMLPVKTEVMSSASQLCPGARRSFFCRIKCKVPPESLSPTIKQEAELNAEQRKKHSSEKKYCVIQCTGYLKSSVPAEMREGPALAEGREEADTCHMSCLVGVARALTDLVREPPPRAPAPPTRRLQYGSRHAPDGKFLFVDQRVTLALGFLPQELLGTSLYEYTPGRELAGVARTHKAALLGQVPLHTPPYSFRRKDGSLATIQTHFKPFKNPWTKDVECLVANNTVIADGQPPVHQDPAQATLGLYNQKVDVEMQRLIESQMESHKIGSAIAEEVLRRSSSEFSPDLPVDLLQDTVFNEQWLLKANGMCEQTSLVDSLLGAEVTDFDEVRNNVPLSAAGTAGTADSPPPPADLPPDTSPAPSPPLGTDGNGEAAMAVIMSLLEADAGLGEPVSFSGMPWSLP